MKRISVLKYPTFIQSFRQSRSIEALFRQKEDKVLVIDLWSRRNLPLGHGEVYHLPPWPGDILSWFYQYIRYSSEVTKPQGDVKKRVNAVVTRNFSLGKCISFQLLPNDLKFFFTSRSLPPVLISRGVGWLPPLGEDLREENEWEGLAWRVENYREVIKRVGKELVSNRKPLISDIPL